MTLKKAFLKPALLDWIDFESVNESKGFKKVKTFEDIPTVDEGMDIIDGFLGNPEDVLITQILPESNWGTMFWDIAYAMEEGLKIEEVRDSFSPESRSYLDLLHDSEIGIEYVGLASSTDLRRFLSLILEGLKKGLIVYSPWFISPDGNKFVFFHPSGDVIHFEKDRTVA